MESSKMESKKKDLGEYYYYILSISITSSYMNTPLIERGEKEKFGSSGGEDMPKVTREEVRVRISNC